jgi:hypothetical protein
MLAHRTAQFIDIAFGKLLEQIMLSCSKVEEILYVNGGVERGQALTCGLPS